MCRNYLSSHKNEIDNFFDLYFNEPKLNIPKKFKLQFTYLEIFQKGKIKNYNLRNNVYDKFKNINNMCILTNQY